MKLTVTNFTGDIFSLDVSADIEVENLCALCEFETKVPASQIVLVWNGKRLEDKGKSINSYGVKDGDVLLMQQITAASSSYQRQRAMLRGEGWLLS